MARPVPQSSRGWPEGGPLRLTLSSGIDLFMLAACALALAATVWVLVDPSQIISPDLGEVRGGALVRLFDRVVGATGLRIVAAVLGWQMLCLSLGSALRLLDRRPALEAGPDGLYFHPSLARHPIAWADVQAIRIAGSPGRLVFAMPQRHWALSSPFAGDTISLSLAALGLSWSEARSLVSRLQAMKRSALA